MIKNITINNVNYVNMSREIAVSSGLMSDEEYSRALIDNQVFFQSEKAIALQVMDDYQLGLYSITDQDITETRVYIQSIEPLSVASNQRSAMPRPEIFSRYKRNPYEL